MENLSPTARKICMLDDHNIKFKSLYIDMDLAIHRSLNSPRGSSWLQKSLDSHEDFEFTMSHDMLKKDDLIHLQSTEAASADKLFFKGQILPLQQSPKLQSLQPIMAGPKLDEVHGENGKSLSTHLRDYLSLQSLNQRPSRTAGPSETSLGSLDNEKSCFTRCYNEEISTLPPHYRPSQGGLMFNAPLMQRRANEEGLSADFSLHDGPCRLDGTFDLFQNDSRSSSFRSHHSNVYWSSTEKDSSRDSSGSSRCSNGSYHDYACVQGTVHVEKKALHNFSKGIHPSIVNSSFNQSELCDIMGEFSSSANPNHGRGGLNHGKPPPAVSRLNSRRWSWKGLFTGLRKASKLWGDDGRSDVGSHDSSTEGKRPIFTFKELPGVMGESGTSGYRRSVGHDWEWQANTFQFVSREGSLKKGNIQPAKATVGVRDDCEEHQVAGTIYCLRSGGRQEASFDDSAGEVTSKREPKGKVQGNVWNAKESWSKCIDRMKKGTKLSVNANCKLVPNYKELESNMSKSANRMMNEEDKMDIYRVMKAKSLSSTPLAKSPVRRPEYGNKNTINMGTNLNGSLYEGTLYPMQGEASGLPASISSKAILMKSSNKKVGFAASCPASMRSSPHHSGLLAVVNKATPDLHTAIQGAIAHCKQSQLASANPPP
ncbi:hypothetical protein GOP47_0012797 [Adiantum capillus-veneris]|uniref:Uncharacterized protein n=1 Tax=Adiantum capillus-veneris TaxID=13818 RepID=A0A9D4URZ3_ADICA|nr:hypothetical protein GOP47_0012797 [Adiantum capillus-veneris]